MIEANKSVTSEVLTLMLQDYIWETLTLEEWLEVLQVVANIEQAALGLPHELNLITANCDELVAGTYYDDKHEITISVDYLLEAESQEVVRTVCHEARHAAQHRMVDAYDEVRPELKSLEMFQDARIFKKEFSDHADSSEDILSYYRQKVEIDANAYSDKEMKEYFEQINEYVSGKSK